MELLNHLKNIVESKSEKKKVALNKPFRTPNGPKKFAVYVKDGESIKKVTFGSPEMEIKRDDPARRKSFRARHNCENPGPKTGARYWSCKMWQGGKSVSAMLEEFNFDEYVASADSESLKALSNNITTFTEKDDSLAEIASFCILELVRRGENT